MATRRIKNGRLETRRTDGTWVHSFNSRDRSAVDPRVILARKQEHDRLAECGFSQADIREEIERQERYGLLAVPAEVI